MKTFAVRCAFLLVMVAAAAGLACSNSSSNSSSPSSPSPGGTCRTYPTAASVTTTTLGLTLNTLLTASFNASTNQATITTRFADGSLCTTTVNSYRTSADFVDEVRVIPPVNLQTATATTNGGACGAGTSNVAYVYDSQRRLVSFGSGASTTTYTAWDGAGRPTVGAFPGTSISNVYDDAARTLTQTQTSPGSTAVTVTTFDANGSNIRVVNTTGPIVSTTTFAITSTDRVCK